MMSEFNTNECTPLDLLEEAFDAAEDMETSEEKDIGEACGVECCGTLIVVLHIFPKI